MRFPRITTATALVVAALVVPAVAPPLDARPAGVIGMGQTGYEITGVSHARLGADGVPEITIHRGERLTFQNDSRWVHIIGPGKRGLVTDPGLGAMTPLKMLEENDVFSTHAWMTEGTYDLTCTVHTEMNARVVVLP